MGLVVIFGPQAVGKMTVGQKLCELTGYKLFYNHMVIDMVGEIFDKEHMGGIWQLNFNHYKLISTLWQTVLEFGAYNDENLVFTLTWDMSNKGIESYMKELENKYNKQDEKVYFVELECDIQTRLERNSTENRLKNKVCKRNIEQSNEELKFETHEFRLNSRPGELKFNNYIRINNKDKSAREVALIIKEFMEE